MPDAVNREHPDIPDLHPHPLREFALWYEQAKESEDLPEAMALATVTPDGQPTARMVLLKGYDEAGLEFYTSYDSPKAAHIQYDGRVALLFYWRSLRRQVRFEGTAARLPGEVSRAYWDTRPRGSRLAAWVSTQSAEIADRAALESAVEEFSRQYPDDDIPLPPSWGGYRVHPHRAEFFISRQDRLHDRFLYERTDGDSWRLVRLSP